MCSADAAAAAEGAAANVEGGVDVDAWLADLFATAEGAAATQDAMHADLLASFPNWGSYDDDDDDDDDDDAVVKCVGRCANRDDDDLTDKQWKKKRNKKIGMGFGITFGVCVCLFVLPACIEDCCYN